MSAVISVRALSTVAPSRSRATPASVKRNDALARVDCAAIHMSVRASGKLNVAGMTPTTSVGTPSKMIERPTMLGSPPNLRTHRPWDKTATGAAPVTPSGSMNHRPSAGWTPRTETSEGVARVIWSRRGSRLR